MATDWMAELQKLDGAIRLNPDFDAYANVLQTHSPSVNFTFGKAQGLPLGYSLLLYGPPKGGKSLVKFDFVGKMQADYPDGYAICFDTEMREDAQLTPDDMKVWGIDPRRYCTYQCNTPDLVYDRIADEISKKCERGFPLKLVIIDSINSLQGRRGMEDDTIMTQQRGDEAMTNQVGLKRILPVQRKYGFALIVVAQQRAEQDQTEVLRGNKIRPAVAFGVQHHCEYFMYVEPNNTKAGRTDLAGHEFIDENVTRDMTGAKNKDGERIGHKIRVTMKDSSLGPKRRMGEFAYSYQHGIVNRHEEIFLLGVGRGIIEHPSGTVYTFMGRKWTGGQPAMLAALAEEPELCSEVLKEIKRRDLQGAIVPTAAEAEEEASP